MAQSKPSEQEQLLEKIRRLTPERLAEVEDFVRAKAIGLPRAGGLHHRYAWSEAA